MIQQKNKKKWIIIGIVVFIIFALFIMFTYSPKKKSGIESIVISKTDIIQKVSVTGTIKPTNVVNLGFDIPGRVSNINIKVGDRVKKNNNLVQLDSGDLESQLLVAQANLSEASANLAKLKTGTRIEKINIQKVKVNNAEITFSNAKKDVMDRLRDAYSKSDDAIRNKSSQLFNNPESTNPKLNVIISNNQLETSVESSRLEVGKMLKLWKRNLDNLTDKSSLLAFVSETNNNLYKTRDFLSSLALVVNSLTNSSSITQSTVDMYKANIWAARSSVNTAIGNLTVSSGSLRSTQSALTLSKNELVLEEAGATSEEITAQKAIVFGAEASVQSAKVNLSKTTLHTPISGIVTKVNIKVGEAVPANMTAISVMSSDPFEIDANIAESDIEKISIGDSADVTLDAYNDNDIFKAKVIKIDPSDVVIEGVSTYKTTFKLFPNGKNMRPGMTANIDILTNKRENVLAVPMRSVKIKNDIKFVRVIKSDGTIENMNVKTGLRGSDGRIEILSGIKAGDRVVTFMP